MFNYYGGYMQGIILAAGMGKRLKDLTNDNTKCMVKVNGISLIERSLKQLDELNLKHIVIVVGYEGKKLIDYIKTLNIKTPIVFINNDIYDKTNNIYSLSLAKQYLLEDDTLLLESDIIFEDGILKSLVDDPRDTLALVDKYEAWMDGTCVKLDKNDSIIAFIPGKELNYSEKSDYYKTINIYKFSKKFSESYYVPSLDAYQKAYGNNEYYEQVLKVISTHDDSIIKAKRLDGHIWYEIDDAQDLDIAESLFDTSENRIYKISKRFGGYWRYPNLLDFCYLVNPYYPPKRLQDEMISSFNNLLSNYPSGMRVNSFLSAKLFNVKPEHIVVGNGASELIKCLLENIEGKIGYIQPTFNEYPNRIKSSNSVVFKIENDDFRYDENDIINYFDVNKVENLILINPDNPSGNFINKNGMIKIADWTKENKIRLIIDESFIDFSDKDESSLLYEKIMNSYPNLIIIKSISKSYGIPGARLGILSSYNDELIAKLKKDVSIWNINSFGEFWLQIAEKYNKEYSEGLNKFRLVRKEFISELRKINGLRILPTQANFVMVEILDKYTAKDLTEVLFSKYNILIKDLTSKIKGNKQYIRLAIRNEEDNKILIDALKKEFC